jgi:hypothetical protein
MRGIIILKKRELLIPEAYMEKVLKEYPHGLSFATARKTGIVLERNEGSFELKDVMDLQQNLVDDETFMWFMDAEKFHQEDVQPFVLIGKDDDNADIVAFADGTFPNFIPTASDHTNEYFLFNKYIIPKLHSLGGENFDAIFNNLGNDIVKMELQGICGDRGTIVLLAKNGRNMVFDKNDLKREYEWGWTTHHLDYEEKSVELPKSVVEQAKQLGKKLMGKADDRAPSKPIASVVPIQQPPKTETAIPQEQTVVRKFKPPPGTSRKAAKKLYKRITGMLPLDWKEMPEVEYKKTVLKSFEELKDIDKSKYATLVEGPIPISNPKLIASVQGDDQFAMDKKSQVVPDPERTLEERGKVPSFWEEFTNLPKNWTDEWKWDKFRDFAGKYPLAMAKLAWSYRNEDLFGEEPDETEGSAESVEAPEVVAKETPAIVERPAVVRPARKSISKAM